MRTTALAAALGAGLMYFLDPNRGKRRRNMAADRLLAAVRGGARKTARRGRAATAEAYGWSQKLTHLTPEHPIPPNDVTLARKVESELFRDPSIPKGRINVNAEDGTIVLRGELDQPEQISSIEAQVRKIPGVRDVENLLHLPKTPARMS
jgi:hypothetical protein